jgi:hypothetical protein
MIKKLSRTLAAMLAGAIALTAVSITPASAGRRNNAAAIAAFSAIVGTIATIAIEQQHRDDWERYNRERAYYGYQPAPPPYYHRHYYRPF